MSRNEAFGDKKALIWGYDGNTFGSNGRHLTDVNNMTRIHNLKSLF